MGILRSSVGARLASLLSGRGNWSDENYDKFNESTSRTTGKTYVEATRNICQHLSESLEVPPLGYKGYDSEKKAHLYVSLNEMQDSFQSPARKSPKHTFRVIH